MRHLKVAAIVLSVLSTACDSTATAPTEGPSSVLGGSPAAPGSVLTLQYTNTSGVTFGVNACQRGVERLQDGRWVALPPEFRLCTDDLQLVREGISTTLEVDVPLFIPDGQYRFKLTAYKWRTPIEPGVHDIVTAPFAVKN